MATYLRQSTTITIQMGPALDETNGVTPVTTLSPTVTVSKAGAAFAARSSATAITHDAAGWYRVELNTTDTNTLGRLVVQFNDAATHLPVWHEFSVVPAVIYDSLVGGTDLFDVSVTQWNGTAVASPQTAGIPQVNIQNANNVPWNSGGISAAVLATDTITSAKIADNAITRTKFNANTGMQSIQAATCAGGSANTITLDATASTIDDFYDDLWVLLTGGTGVGQVRRINQYIGSSQIATVTPDWKTNPISADTTFAIIPSSRAAIHLLSCEDNAITGNALNAGCIGSSQIGTGAIDADAIAANAIGTSEFSSTVIDAIADQVWNELTSGHTGAGSFGEQCKTDIDAIQVKTDFLPSATAGAAGGVFIAGTNAATSVTTALTANITGNVSGSVGSVTGAVGSVTGNVSGNVTGSVGSVTGALNTLTVDAVAESAAVPAANANLKDKINWLATLARNKRTTTTTTETVRNDADSGNIATAAVSDDGTTATRAEWV